MAAMAFAPVSCRLAGLSVHANPWRRTQMPRLQRPSLPPRPPRRTPDATSESNRIASSRVESSRVAHAASLAAGPSARLPARRRYGTTTPIARTDACVLLRCIRTSRPSTRMESACIAWGGHPWQSVTASAASSNANVRACAGQSGRGATLHPLHPLPCGKLSTPIHICHWLAGLAGTKPQRRRRPLPPPRQSPCRALLASQSVMVASMGLLTDGERRGYVAQWVDGWGVLGHQTTALGEAAMVVFRVSPEPIVALPKRILCPLTYFPAHAAHCAPALLTYSTTPSSLHDPRGHTASRLIMPANFGPSRSRPPMYSRRLHCRDWPA
ncbi:hypothetical protein PSV08DRAFT_252264 [Bipolaris maydis]|uniref:uncharacterized protein n=1 Tax=Cochliobolus heterostrophus TaxID=5016 RepID=UPI0024CF9462|nr:hypothetical protein J3E73DRAFT_261897 [Bipolaris maydis]KAJ5055669.1 hypothetical protein J3E74DRAFT_294865 [Bipolaris maydis]KAJ6265785.1 hypothetical protein PSV08DRAFT_252264 [Bipolaris maydis]KAJ6276844.1 hypothetical protein J3E71DRAFT_245543 [Bipolaris maydis]